MNNILSSDTYLSRQEWAALIVLAVVVLVSILAVTLLLVWSSGDVGAGPEMAWLEQGITLLAETHPSG